MKKLRDFRKPERDRAFSYWGPAGIAVGIILILNDVEISTECMSFELKAGMDIFNLGAGIVLIVLGLLALYLIAQEQKIALANVGLMTGVSFFFWGTHVFNTLNNLMGFGVGWAGIIVGIVLIVMGYIWAPK